MKASKEVKKDDKLIYSRIRLIELPEPTLERQPGNNFSVMFGPRAIDIKIEGQTVLVSLRDLYKNHHKTLRRQVTWRDLIDASNCSDPMGKGWVDLPTAQSILKRCGSFKMFKALFKMKIKTLANNIQDEEMRQAAYAQARGEEVAEEEEEEVEEVEPEPVKAQDEDITINPELERYRRFYESENPQIEEAEHVMQSIETAYAEDLSYHLWWSVLMRDEAYRRYGTHRRRPEILPIDSWGSWPRPYPVIGPERVKYVDDEDPTAREVVPVSSMLNPPHVCPPFQFTVPLAGDRRVQLASGTWISIDNPRIDVIKGYQIMERFRDGEREWIKAGEVGKEMEKLEKEQELVERLYPNREHGEGQEEQDDPRVKTEEPVDFEFKEEDYEAIEEIVDPNPSDFNPELFEGEKNEIEFMKRKNADFDPLDVGIPAEQRYKYYKEGVKSLQTGLNTAYQRAVYEHIHERKNLHGQKIEPSASSCPNMPQQAMAKVKNMIDEMLATAAQNFKTNRQHNSYALNPTMLGYKGVVGHKHMEVGRTEERLKELFEGPEAVSLQEPAMQEEDKHKASSQDNGEDAMDEDREEEPLSQLQLAIKMATGRTVRRRQQTTHR
ncbi:hypothetical protein CJU89_2804 [Yarrowia sp. B02]|nr:hypothetical protein CJU89_2804 [Yarrowia sp. B02]